MNVEELRERGRKRMEALEASRGFWCFKCKRVHRSSSRIGRKHWREYGDLSDLIPKQGVERIDEEEG